MPCEPWDYRDGKAIHCFVINSGAFFILLHDNDAQVFDNIPY